MSAAAFKDRLRADLKIAMQARDTVTVKVLRALIGAVDNAEAVTVAQGPYQSRAFGDPDSEVPRRVLDGEAIATVLAAETASRLSAADEYEQHGRPGDAVRLRDEAALIGRYRA